jgi:hypothetical protein
MSWLVALACAAALLWAINRVSPWIYDVMCVAENFLSFILIRVVSCFSSSGFT